MTLWLAWARAVVVYWLYATRLRRYCWQHDETVWFWHRRHPHYCMAGGALFWEGTAPWLWRDAAARRFLADVDELGFRAAAWLWEESELGAG